MLDTDIEFIISAFLKEEGFPNDVHPINLGAAVPISWYIVVKVNPNLMVSVTDGVIKLEGFRWRTDFGSWDIAHPTSFDDLLEAIRVNSTPIQYPSSRGRRRMAERQRDSRPA